ELALEGPALDLQADFLVEVAFGNRADRAGDFGRRPDEIIDEAVDGRHLARTYARRIGHDHPLSQAAFLADDPAHPADLGGATLADRHHVVEGVGDLAGNAGKV